MDSPIVYSLFSKSLDAVLHQPDRMIPETTKALLGRDTLRLDDIKTIPAVTIADGCPGVYVCVVTWPNGQETIYIGSTIAILTVRIAEHFEHREGPARRPADVIFSSATILKN
jgi:hypothetical protein